MDLLPLLLIASLVFLTAGIFLWKRLRPSRVTRSLSVTSSQQSNPRVAQTEMPVSQIPQEETAPSSFLMALAGDGANDNEYFVKIFDEGSDPISTSPTSASDQAISLSTLGLAAVLEKLVASMPLIAQALKKGRIVEIVGPPELLKGLKDGSVNLAKDKWGNYFGFYRESGANKISGQVLFRNVRAFVAPAMAFQVLAIATQQYYLHSIDKKLDALLVRIKHILQRMRAESWGKLRGAQNTIEDIRIQMAAEAVAIAEFWPRLANVEQDVNAVMDEAKDNLVRFCERVESTANRGGSPGDCRKLLEEADADFRLDLGLYQEAARARLLWFQVVLIHDARVSPSSMDTRRVLVNRFAEDYGRTQEVVATAARTLRQLAKVAVRPNNVWEIIKDLAVRTSQVDKNRKIPDLAVGELERRKQMEQLADSLLDLTRLRLLSPSLDSATVYQLRQSTDGRVECSVYHEELEAIVSRTTPSNAAS